MCRTKEEGGRRCRKHQKQWEKLTEEELEEVRRAQEELQAANKRSERVTVRITAQQQSWLHAESVTPAVARARVVAAPYLTDQPLPQVLSASEAAAANATEQQNETHPTGRTPTAGEVAPFKLAMNFTREEDAALQTEAAFYGIPKAEYVRRQLTEEDVRRHPMTMGRPARQVREAWLSIPDESRYALVQQKVTAEQRIAASKERMRELERLIILKRGTGKKDDFEAVGAAMREKALLKLDVEELEEQHAVQKQQEREAIIRREQTIQKLRTALHLSMQALRLTKSSKHAEAFILGFGTVAVIVAAARVNRAA